MLSTMKVFICLCALLPLVAAAALAPGNYEFSVTHQELRRTYHVHVPPQAAGGRLVPVRNRGAVLRPEPVGQSSLVPLKVNVSTVPWFFVRISLPSSSLP